MYAAAVPMNGGGNTALAGPITQIPVWNFHAVDDGVVPVSESRLIVQAVRRAGGNVVYTEYNSGGHGIWTPAYNTSILMDWIYSQKRGTFSPAPPQLRIVGPTDQPSYILNGTNLNLSGLATNANNSVGTVAWTNFSTGVSSGLAQGKTDWSVTNISVNPSITNLVLVIASGLIVSPPLLGPTTFNDTLTVIVPPLNPQVTKGSNGLTIMWTGVPGGRYHVQWTTALCPPIWTSFTNILTSTDGAFSFLDDGTQSGGLAGPRYYRLKQLP